MWIDIKLEKQTEPTEKKNYMYKKRAHAQLIPNKGERQFSGKTVGFSTEYSIKWTAICT